MLVQTDEFHKESTYPLRKPAGEMKIFERCSLRIHLVIVCLLGFTVAPCSLCCGNDFLRDIVIVELLYGVLGGMTGKMWRSRFLSRWIWDLESELLGFLLDVGS